MTFNKNEFEAGKQWARSSHLAKREQAIPQTRTEALKERNDRIREWGERARAEQAETTATPVPAEAVRHVGRFPSSYGIGDTRPAMDGTTWRRVS